MDHLTGLAALGNPDPQSHARSLEYFEQLKNSADGWKLCAQAYTSEEYRRNGPVRFFCLQVCEHYLKTRYHQASREEQSNVREFLMSCLQLSSWVFQSREGVQEMSFILNKVAQIVSLAFVVDYPSRWPTFFEDLLSTMNQGHQAVDMYLRVLVAIDQEVVDREVIHTPEESVRNTAIKDRMRETCVNRLAESWLHILNAYAASHAGLVCLCLEVVGKYVSWIDISLVANDHYVSVLLRFLTQPLLRESCCDCIYEVLGKGMEPMAKLQLVESFFNVLDKNGILTPSTDEEGDFLAKLSKLMCGVGLALIHSWTKAANNPSDQAKIQMALEAKIPYMLRFLGDEDDDVSGAVGDFATEYISMLKAKGPLSSTQREHVQGMLHTLVNKMKYDESYNFEQEGEDEAMFMEYRKQMRVIFNNLAQLDADLILMTVRNIVSQTLPQWKAVDFRDVEMALTLLYSVAEAVPMLRNILFDFTKQTQTDGHFTVASHGQHFSGNNTKVSVLQDMMRMLMTSQVSHHGHVVVQLQFFETVVRYDKFFQVEPEHIPECLSAFLDQRGLHHNSPKVRSRCAYLFSRIIKSLKAHLLPYLVDVFNQLQDLLVLNSPVGNNANGIPHLLSDEDQFFVYETASTLIISSTLPPERKQEMMRMLLAPIAGKFEELLASLCSETNEDRQAAYGKCISNAMGLASRASKGFSGTQTMKQCGCEPAFTELLRLFGKALDTPTQRSHIQFGVRQYLHRMVVCMDSEILPFIPPVLTHLLKHPEARELYDFLPLINQLVMKFKVDIIPFLCQILMPLVNAIFTVMNSPADERDQQAANDRKMLQRGYYQFLSTIVSSDCVNVFKALGDMKEVEKVLMSLIQGVMRSQDPTSQRCCFSVLKKLTEAWGSGDDGIQGFERFLYEQVVPACILAPMSPSFDLNDGQTSVALGECAACLKTILDKRGVEMIDFLHGHLPTFNLSMEKIQQFCQAMQGDIKTFKLFLKNFFLMAKS